MPLKDLDVQCDSLYMYVVCFKMEWENIVFLSFNFEKMGITIDMRESFKGYIYKY